MASHYSSLMLHFVFSADPLDSRRVDEYYAGQKKALAEVGFATSVVADGVFDGTAPLASVPKERTVVYRGWMVDAKQYQNFAAAVHAGGSSPLTSPEAYLRTHHLPNWYSLLRDLTPETVVFPPDVDLASELRRLDWPAYFIKDYVKSLKTSAGSLITNAAEAQRVADDMLRFRGTIEGGFCVRRVERFQPATERRYFVLHGRPYAPSEADVIPEIVRTVAGRIDSPFFSVDVALNEDRVLRVVEIGDGQVSDLVGWTVEELVRMWCAYGLQSPPNR